MKSKSFKIVFSFFLSLAIGTTINPAESNQPEFEKQEKEVVVIGDVISQQKSNNVEVIVVDDETKALHGGKVESILQNQAGIIILNQGSATAQKQILLRGANANQTGIYINGFALQDARSAQSFLENLPLFFFDKIEIYKQHSPFGLSDSHIGGAINFQTDRKFSTEKENQSALSLKADTLQNYVFDGMFALFHSTHFLRLTGALNRFSYFAHQGTLFYDESDTEDKKNRVNDELYSLQYLFLKNIEKQTIKHDFLFMLNAQQNGLAGIIGLENLHTYQRKTNANFQYKFSSVIFESGLLQNSLAADFSSVHVFDPYQEIFLGNDKLHRLQYNLSNNMVGQMFFDAIQLNAGMQLEAQFFQLYENSINNARRMYIHYGLYAEKEFFNSTRLMMKATIRLQHDESFQVEFLRFMPQQNQYHFVPGGFVQSNTDIFNRQNEHGQLKISAKGQISYNHRPPSINEIYGDASGILPAHELLPEKSYSAQAGIHSKFYRQKKFLDYELSFHYSKVENLIEFVANSQRSFIAMNTSQAQIYGVENKMQWYHSSWLHFEARYDYLVAQDKSLIAYYYNKYLPYRPLHQASFLHRARWKILTFQQQYLWQGALFKDKYNSYQHYSKPKLRVNLSLLVKFNLHHQMTLQADNITDNASIDVIGHPLPGRSFSLQYSYFW